jgi:hypothetical protein
MELWTEYEGRTIDGAFPLTKLLRPEGRSAFFSTSNGNGAPKLIRLIESHFDDEEILARWHGVAALNHPHLLKLEKYGQVELDDTSLVYAVMEPVDTNLGEVVTQQRLTIPEARQLATSVASALKALHEHGFVHEHVEPVNVLAVGEVVKLRSDCIREAPEGPEGQARKQRDAHDLAVVLLQALTTERTLETAARYRPLPAPFEQIVPKGISGEWGIAEITAALQKQDAPAPAVAAPAATAAIPPMAPQAAEPRTTAKGIGLSPSEDQTPALQDKFSSPAGYETQTPKRVPASVRIGGIALAVILVFWLGWHFLHIRSGSAGSTAQQASAPAPAASSTPSQPAPASAPKPQAAVQSAPEHSVSRNQGARGQWRVIAFTYNRQDQAQHKSETVAQKHPDLKPEVFSPTGRAPYLVALGGPMTREEAVALVSKVRAEGLPHDTYAQNYSGNGR